MPRVGILILRDLSVSALYINGVNVGNPKADPPTAADMEIYGPIPIHGGFRGYCFVPVDDPITFYGVLTHGGGEPRKTNEITVCIDNDFDQPVAVYRHDYESNTFVREEEDLVDHFTQLAMSGSMRQAGALRPFPSAARAAMQSS